MNPWNIKKEDFPKNGSLDEKIRFVLGYAILAPSTHNVQPWLFRIKDSSVEIYFDPALKLPEGDPKNRDLYISMGCMIENLAVASVYFGILGDVRLEPKDNYIAEVSFKNYGGTDHASEYLVDTIPVRINARGVFEDRTVPEELSAELISLNRVSDLKINFVTDKAKINRLALLTAEGLKLAYERNNFRGEMSKWMRNSLTLKKDGLPGYSLRMPFFFSFVIPTLVRFFNIGPLLARLNYKSMSSVPFICIISAEQSDPKIWIETGRLAERYMLKINSQGIRTSIFVASIEMGDLYKKVQEITGDIFTPQFLFCAGYMKDVQKHSPRHVLGDKLI